jgi:ribonuclease HI
MTTIFTDGSSRGNPGPGGWGAIVISDADHGDTATVVELGGREELTTNNRMELMAVIQALHSIGELPQLSEKAEEKADRLIRINSDSAYVINGITKWVHGWVKKNWITSQKEEVLNRDLWEKLMDAVRSVEGKSGTRTGSGTVSAGAKGTKIIWNQIGGHVGIAGNERCDEIATLFADGQPVELFSGRLADYPLRDVVDVAQEKENSKSKTAVLKKSHSKAAAYSYVSLVDGVVQIHTTWAECEARVKGASGAKYKKALSKADEVEIIASFREF